MTDDKLAAYRRVEAPPPSRNQLWPLYGAGLGSLGDDAQPIEVPMPKYGPDELLVRHDATGLCFSDIKVIRLGPDQTLVLSYKDSCVRETITGGTVTIGTDQSEVRSGEVTRMRGPCLVGRVDVSNGEFSVGGRSFRGLTR